MPHRAEVERIIESEVRASTAAHTHSGAESFSGRVSFTGQTVAPVSVSTTSALTLHSSVYSGKTLLFTSLAASSRHVRITLPVMSAMTSGFWCKIVNGHAVLSSFGISLLPTSATQIDGTTKILKSGSKAAVGASIEVHKVGGKIYILNANPGRAVATSLAWIAGN